MQSSPRILASLATYNGPKMSHRFRFLLIASFTATATLLSSTCAIAQSKPVAVDSVDPTSSLSLILKAAADSDLAKHKWPAVSGVDENGDTDIAPAKGAAPIGYTKGMAVVFAKAYSRLKQRDPIISDLARLAQPQNDRDVVYQFRDLYRRRGIPIASGGEETLRALFVLLFELGVRESDGRPYLGIDDGKYKPDEPADEETTEAGLFQSSYNFRYKNPLAQKVIDNYLSMNPQQGTHYLRIFSEGVSLPANNSDRSIGKGRGLAFQDRIKSNPQFAVEFAAATVRAPGAFDVVKARGYNNYRFLKLHQMEVSVKANRLFRSIARLVDKHGAPRL